jgi:hypothetical protein
MTTSGRRAAKMKRPRLEVQNEGAHFAEDEQQDDHDDDPHDDAQDEEEGAEEEEVEEGEEGARRAKVAKRAATGGGGKGRRAGARNIRWIERKRYAPEVDAAEMIATAKIWEDWDWAVACGGQRDGTIMRNLKCISHANCPVRVGYIREAVGAEWVLHTNSEDHPQTPRQPYTAKGLSAEWKREVDAMLLQVRTACAARAHPIAQNTHSNSHHRASAPQFSRPPCDPGAESATQGKGPELIVTALAKQSGPHGAMSDADKLSRLPTARKIKSYKARSRDKLEQCVEYGRAPHQVQDEYPDEEDEREGFEELTKLELCAARLLASRHRGTGVRPTDAAHCE